MRMCVRPLNETRRRLVLDTNVFLNNGFEAVTAITDFLERLEISRCHADKVLIPYVVLEELDRKRSQEEYSDTAKRALESTGVAPGAPRRPGVEDERERLVAGGSAPGTQPFDRERTENRRHERRQHR